MPQVLLSLNYFHDANNFRHHRSYSGFALPRRKSLQSIFLQEK